MAWEGRRNQARTSWTPSLQPLSVPTMPCHLQGTHWVPVDCNATSK